MTTERVNEISEFLAKDLGKAKELLALSPEEAAAKISAEGFAVTAADLIAYSDEVRSIAVKEGELGEGDLENVAGGIAASTIILGGMVVGFLVGKGVW